MTAHPAVPPLGRWHDVFRAWWCDCLWPPYLHDDDEPACASCGCVRPPEPALPPATGEL